MEESRIKIICIKNTFMKISGQEVSFSKILLSILHIVGWTLKPGCGDTTGLISLDFRAVDPDNDNKLPPRVKH